MKLPGKVFGMLTVIEVIQEPSKQKNRFKYKLKCLCKCGNYKYYQFGDLNGQGTVSCGCFRKEKWRRSYYAWLKEQENSQLI